ncbi:hypothetical protein Ahy_A04g017980 [Arachis hypogaea]|uniref:Uncharacterized protein n=1 Tax=Arachis hypogaea TaxID=3818 RepID=A0A445DCM4_ARAHY|nr:hypothetical protein Ahy_A04g017980 [Arachis hypogaea]
MFQIMKKLNKLMLCLMAAELFNWVAFPLGERFVARRTFGQLKILYFAGSLAVMFYISKLAKDKRRECNDSTPSSDILALVFCFFGVLGISIGITFSIPPTLVSIYSNESGAGKVRKN